MKKNSSLFGETRQAYGMNLNFTWKQSKRKNIVRVSVLIKHLLSFQSFWRSQAYFLALQTGEKFRQQLHWVLATTYLFFFLFLSFFRLFFFAAILKTKDGSLQGWYCVRALIQGFYYVNGHTTAIVSDDTDDDDADDDILCE